MMLASFLNGMREYLYLGNPTTIEPKMICPSGSLRADIKGSHKVAARRNTFSLYFSVYFKYNILLVK